MVYDNISGNVVLFGGSEFGKFDDTWIYNLSSNTWAQVSLETKPAPQSLHSMVYDSKNEVIVLFGGNTGDALTNVLVNDTWIYRTYTAMPAFRVLKATISENWKTGGQKAKIMSTFQLGLSKNLTRGLTVTVGDYTETLLPPNLVEKNKTSWYYKRPRGQPKQGIKKLRIKWDKKGDITRDVVKMSILIDNAPIFPGGIPGGSNMNVDILISHGRERASEAIRMVQKRVGMLRYKVRK